MRVDWLFGADHRLAIGRAQRTPRAARGWASSQRGRADALNVGDIERKGDRRDYKILVAFA